MCGLDGFGVGSVDRACNGGGIKGAGGAECYERGVRRVFVLRLDGCLGCAEVDLLGAAAGRGGLGCAT